MNITQFIDIKERIAIGAELTPAQRTFVLDCMNEAVASDMMRVDVPPPMVAVTPLNYLGRIEHFWAFLSVDEGGEGVCAAPLAPGMLTVPMIAADERRLDSLKPLARKLPNIFGKPVRLAKFSTREDIEIYQPETGGTNDAGTT